MVNDHGLPLGTAYVMILMHPTELVVRYAKHGRERGRNTKTRWTAIEAKGRGNVTRRGEGLFMGHTLGSDRQRGSYGSFARTVVCVSFKRICMPVKELVDV